jgi:hypothetical protein
MALHLLHRCVLPGMAQRRPRLPPERPALRRHGAPASHDRQAAGRALSCAEPQGRQRQGFPQRSSPESRASRRAANSQAPAGKRARQTRPPWPRSAQWQRLRL